MKFADIPGHEEVKMRLRRMVDTNHIPHAILLEGPAGTGKFALAQALAQYIHCENRLDGDSCGCCPSCLQHQQYNHIDTAFSFPIKKKHGKATICDDWFAQFKEFIAENPFMDIKKWAATMDNTNTQPQIYVEEAAEIVRRLTFMTRRSALKTALIWLPERMNESAANKLLKFVEEPYSDTVIIMTSDSPRLILPTIYSRTQRIEVPRYTDTELIQILTSAGIDPTQAAEVAPIAEGNINEALTLCSDSEERTQFFNLFTTLMRAAYARRVAELRKWSLDVYTLSREQQLHFLAYIARMIRESFICHLAYPSLTAASPTEQAFLKKFHPFINHKNVEDFIKLIDDGARDIAANGNAKIVFFDIAVRSIILLRR